MDWEYHSQGEDTGKRFAAGTMQESQGFAPLMQPDDTHDNWHIKITIDPCPHDLTLKDTAIQLGQVICPARAQCDLSDLSFLCAPLHLKTGAEEQEAQRAHADLKTDT